MVLHRDVWELALEPVAAVMISKWGNGVNRRLVIQAVGYQQSQ